MRFPPPAWTTTCRWVTFRTTGPPATGSSSCAGGPLGDLELAPAQPRSGPYFGTTEGVLVVRRPQDGSLGLKGGDVVQAVDGRKPASPAHLLRILRSYDRGETFKLDILRNHKRETVTAQPGPAP